MPELAHVSTRIGSLAVEAVGEGPPAILWPSLFCDRRMWRHQVAALAGRHRLILVDPPGHGASGPPRGPFTLDDCAAAACEVLDAYEVWRPAWVGLSWGGMTALRAAVQAPERVRALALLDTSAEALTLWERMRFGALAAVFRRAGMTPWLARRVRRELLGRTTIAERPEFGDELFEAIADRDHRPLLHVLDAVVFDRKSIVERLAAIAAPTLVVVGAEDRATPPRNSRRIADAIPGARLVTIPRAGHLTALEAPAEVGSLLARFLDETAGDASAPAPAPTPARA